MKRNGWLLSGNCILGMLNLRAFMVNVLSDIKIFRLKRSWIRFVLLILCLCPLKARAEGLKVAHDLKVELIPVESRLIGIDSMQIQPGGRARLTFRLSEKAERIQIAINHKPRKFIRRQEVLQVPLAGGEPNGTLAVTVGYSGIFNDSFPVQPVNLDNPGFGVSGTISERGTLLLSGSHWYPELDDGRATFHLTVRAPAGTIAVTAGRSLGYVTRQGKTESVWQVNYPVEGLSLSAARYVVREKKVGRITTATYFLSSDQKLSDDYLTATGRYLSWYADLFGPYPFDKFAVVENFFPTGYGFPSYTLLGSRVMRLPFIIHTSLGHEIAHCWWGNGVQVDYSGGNWSEALTTYVSDYLSKEKESEPEAKNYRLQILRNYATLVKPHSDFALSRFVGRSDPVTKTIGYDKGAMVFHMLRKLVGEDAFWGALRDVYRRRLFKKTSWKDLQRAFEKRAKASLERFFEQWIYLPGGPRFYLGSVIATQRDDNWVISGQVVQEKPYFAFPLTLMLENGGRESIVRKIDLGAEHSTPFQLTSQTPPRKLVLDPNVDVMRRLFNEEFPPSINSLKSSPSVLFIMAEDATPQDRQAAETLALSLGLKSYEFGSENQTDRFRLTASDLIIFGLPKNKELLRRLPAQVAIQERAFQLNDKQYGRDTGVFFGVFGHPYTGGRVAALLWPSASRYARTVVRKVAHYGKYSYLAFAEGNNTDKGLWEINESPLRHRWNKE